MSDPEFEYEEPLSPSSYKNDTSRAIAFLLEKQTQNGLSYRQIIHDETRDISHIVLRMEDPGSTFNNIESLMPEGESIELTIKCSNDFENNQLNLTVSIPPKDNLEIKIDEIILTPKSEEIKLYMNVQNPYTLKNQLLIRGSINLNTITLKDRKYIIGQEHKLILSQSGPDLFNLVVVNQDGQKATHKVNREGGIVETYASGSTDVLQES